MKSRLFTVLGAIIIPFIVGLIITPKDASAYDMTWWYFPIWFIGAVPVCIVLIIIGVIAWIVDGNNKDENVLK